MTIDWINLTDQLPPENYVVETKVDAAGVSTNRFHLLRVGNVFKMPDRDMPVSYQPTHWRWVEGMVRL